MQFSKILCNSFAVCRKAGKYLEFVFLSVDYDSRDLLVHEDKDGTKHSWHHRYDCCPPGVRPQWGDEPTSIISCWLMRKYCVWLGDYIKIACQESF